MWRAVFGFAAVYNIAFGSWAILFPRAFFALFDLETPPQLWIWSCLGMVIGVYGLGYAHVAWKPERGDALAAIGLLGKILGPVGWLWTVHAGEIPPRTYVLILANDLIWWFPFLAYLLRHATARREVIAMVCVALHVAACAALLVVRQGTEAEPNASIRAMFIRNAASSWTICWFLWSLASLSLFAFFAAWAVRLRDLRGSWPMLATAAAACGVCGIGVAFDLASEVIAIAVLADSRTALNDFGFWARCASLLGAGVANGLYCIGGAALSVASWRVEFQRRSLAALAATIWTCGFGLSTASFADQRGLMVLFGAAVMVLFIPWALMTGLRLGRTPG